MTDTTGTGNPLAMYDLTIGCDLYDRETVIDFFKRHAKRWAFQQEIGNSTGYLHWQCRISLISKRRVSDMVKLVLAELNGAHVGPTSNACHLTGNEFYVLKESTRVDGPWTDRDTPRFVQKRFRGAIQWKPWQSTVLDMIHTEPDDRTVNVLIDIDGKSGKSFLTTYLGSHGLASRIPQMKEAKDIMRMVMDKPECDCYFIDLPRAISKRDQNAIYGAIEEIKNGYAFDDRYRFREKYFEPPHVWVFTNHAPDEDLLTKDRWRLWMLHRGPLGIFLVPHRQMRIIPSISD